MAKPATTKKPATTAAKAPAPPPFKPARFVFEDATGGEYTLSIGTEKLNDPNNSSSSNLVPEAARDKVAICFGTSDYNDFNCQGHLSGPQIDRLIAILTTLRPQVTLENPVGSDGDFELIR